MTWHLGPVHVPTNCPNTVITGAYLPSLSYPQPFTYEAPPPPPPREWVNSEGSIWIIVAEHRKPRYGENGPIGTYRTHEKARAALTEWVLEHWDRELTAEEAQEGEVCDGDTLLTIVKQDLE